MIEPFYYICRSKVGRWSNRFMPFCHWISLNYVLEFMSCCPWNLPDLHVMLSLELSLIVSCHAILGPSLIVWPFTVYRCQAFLPKAPIIPMGYIPRIRQHLEQIHQYFSPQ
ncbi:hypothetical protein ACRALDRAFT_211460 [Sodiomyces alcalophilus JCM 7366]|uniref:uncharacterized protein n=1 Tax=Sodiomyces alcalophilus JCM 7366 TaxID=591952 RepID=UPI0039B54DE8